MAPSDFIRFFREKKKVTVVLPSSICFHRSDESTLYRNLENTWFPAAENTDKFRTPCSRHKNK